MLKLIHWEGSLVRIGPNELATDDPELLRRMMAIRSDYSRGPCKYSPMYYSTHHVSLGRLIITLKNAGYNALRFEPGKDNLFSMRDEDAHMQLRNKMAAGVSLRLYCFSFCIFYIKSKKNHL